MPDTQPPAPGTPRFPASPPVSDYGTPPPQAPPAYPSPAHYASSQYPAAPYAPGTIRTKTGPGGLALSSLIIGGMALLGSFIPFLNYITGFFAFIALVLGVIAIFLKGRKKTLAIVASSVSLLAVILSIVLALVYTGLFVDGVDDSYGSDYPSSLDGTMFSFAAK